MKNDFDDLGEIIAIRIPKGSGLHGLTPEPLPVAQLAPKEKLVYNNNATHPIVTIGLGLGIGALIAHIVKKIKL